MKTNQNIKRGMTVMRNGAGASQIVPQGTTAVVVDDEPSSHGDYRVRPENGDIMFWHPDYFDVVEDDAQTLRSLVVAWRVEVYPYRPSGPGTRFPASRALFEAAQKIQEEDAPEDPRIAVAREWWESCVASVGTGDMVDLLARLDEVKP